VRDAVGRANLTGWLLVVLLAVVAELVIRRLGLEDSVARPSDTFSALASELWSGSLSRMRRS
jgi:hypothetical protein